MQQQVYILSAQRTPIGGFLGALQRCSAPELAAVAIRGVVQQAALAPTEIEQLVIGCVLGAGLGQAPARQAALQAGLDQSVCCTSLNKVCGSGMQSVIFAAQMLQTQQAELVIAGGMESMSNAPYLLARARAGLRMGHATFQDHMFVDGLEDAYQPGRLMGVFAEDCAADYQLSRAQQDQYAIASLHRARQAIEQGYFNDEIVPINLQQGTQNLCISTDEQPSKAKLEKIPQLKSAFRDQGTVTAANASSISDGAAALLLSSASYAQRHGKPALARIVAQASYAGAPHLFSTAPVFAIKKLLRQCQWQIDSVDLFEINEAFAIVPLIAMQSLNIAEHKINVNGGACALGHPLGCSGARIVVTLIHALRQRGLKRGVAAICIGGGEALAMALEVD